MYVVKVTLWVEHMPGISVWDGCRDCGKAEDQQQQKKIPIKLRHLESSKINGDDKS